MPPLSLRELNHYPHDAVAMAPYFRTLRAQHLPEGVTMERVVELAGHAVEALAEPLEATPFAQLTKAQRGELEAEAELALHVLEPAASRVEVEVV